MESKIDWSKAPEWATKHGLSGAFKSPVWFDDKKYTYVDGQQDGKEFFYADACTYAAKDFSQVSGRPTIPSWSGEGLPPVGVACMAGCEQVVIVAHHCNGIHAIYAESEVDWLLYYGEPNEFRPIRTPEQIEADENLQTICVTCHKAKTAREHANPGGGVEKENAIET